MPLCILPARTEPGHLPEAHGSGTLGARDPCPNLIDLEEDFHGGDVHGEHGEAYARDGFMELPAFSGLVVGSWHNALYSQPSSESIGILTRG